VSRRRASRTAFSVPVRCPRWLSRVLPAAVPVLGGYRPLRAYCEVRAHMLGSAPPTAFHPRPSWAADEIECRVLLKLLYTNPTPTLATALRHTMTAERQNRAVVLLKVNVLAAAQTDRHVSGASPTAGVIERPAFGRGFLQLFHFTARLERKPAFPSRWRAPGSIDAVLRGVWVRAIWRVRPFPGHTLQPPSPISNPFGTYVRRWPAWWRRLRLRRGRRVAN
jgi:hypothetical protein